MIDRQLIRNNLAELKTAIARKGLEAPLDEIFELDAQWRKLQSEFETQKAEVNRISKSIGQLMGQGKREEAEAVKAEAKAMSDKLPELEERAKEIDARISELELEVPNPPHASTPDGMEAEDNPVVRTWGEKPSVETKPHWEIAQDLKLFDTERGAKISGSGFIVYTGVGARFQRALFNFMADHQSSRGYYEVYPPYLVLREPLVGTGNLPKFEDDLYKTPDGMYLVPTAEVPVTNLYAGEILNGEDLTLNLAAYSACFRREAGAAGKDTRGLLRIHQFDKVEMVKFCKPEDSYGELEKLIVDAESVLQVLGLHYRVIELCAGDMGFKGAKAYDLEVWAPGVDKYLEISSCTNFEAFQARRANIRFRRAQGEKPEYVHILNGSGLACPRLYAALLETYLQPDGSVLVPEPLRPYVGTDRIVAGAGL
jgi:seryl-tRNA synthetase